MSRRCTCTTQRKLEHVRSLLTATGRDAGNATLGLFSTEGFTGELVAEAARRQDEVILVDLERLYGV